MTHEIDQPPDVRCPWCGEGDFDLAGLKGHLLHGWCDPFNECRREAGNT